MAQYNFKGNLDNITDRQLEFINDVIKENGFDKSEVIFEAVGKAGDNYMSNIKRIIIEEETRSISIIAKIAPSFEAQRKFTNAHIVFNNESIMYTEVLPKLVQLQINAGVPETERLKYAKCYGSLVEEPNEVILLEDLYTLEYTIIDRFVPLSNDCIRSVLKNLAIYHSLSFVLKEIEPATYNNFKKALNDIWLLPEGAKEMKSFCQKLENDTLSVLDNSDHIYIVKNKIVSTVDTWAKLSKEDNDSKYSVILQADTWRNNIMFKVDGKVLPKSIMIDYQLCKNGSPVFDLLYMIFNCADYLSRKKHFYKWIDFYHSELNKSLSNFNLKINYVYPREQLDADMKRYGKHLFGLAIVLTTLLIRKSDDAEKMLEVIKDTKEQVQEYSVVQLVDNESKLHFKSLVLGIINNFTEFGLI